jgi:uncharacterized membrane protein
MFQLSYSYENNLAGKNSRIDSIDVLRGVVMALMALDHCRDFFHMYAFNYSPEDLRFTTPIVFYTRWITHFCAPVFIFLTGISALLYQQKNKASNKQMAKYLLVRGLILILLEITIVRFAWRFYIDYSSIGGLVIWAIGWSMIALAGLIFFSRKLILWISLIIIFGHNFLDSVNFNGSKFGELVWAFLHKSTFVNLSDDFGVNILYPVLPMIGLIGLGYYVGKWFTIEYDKEIRTGYLFYAGLGMVFLFFTLRILQVVTEQYSYVFYLDLNDISPEHIQRNELIASSKAMMVFLMENYGDPSTWKMQDSFAYNVMAFLNVTKYPMSLFYILITLGPAFILLSFLEGKNNFFTRILKVFGSVPLFYYILHLFLIHALAIILAVLTHLDKMDKIISGDWHALSVDYGFRMPIVYLIWFVVLAILYPACRAFGRFKAKKKYKILAYL